MAEKGFFGYEPGSDLELAAIAGYPVHVEQESAWIDEIDPSLRQPRPGVSTEEVCRMLGIDYNKVRKEEE